LRQQRETARLVAEAVRGPGARVRPGVAVAVRAAQVPWLEPDINDHLRSLVAGGVRSVIVSPTGFVSDHLEVAWDLDTEGPPDRRRPRPGVPPGRERRDAFRRSWRWCANSSRRTSPVRPARCWVTLASVAWTARWRAAGAGQRCSRWNRVSSRGAATALILSVYSEGYGRHCRGQCCSVHTQSTSPNRIRSRRNVWGDVWLARC